MFINSIMKKKLSYIRILAARKINVLYYILHLTLIEARQKNTGHD